METLRARPENTRPVVRHFSLLKAERLFREHGWRTLYAGEKFIVVSPRGLAWRRIKNRGHGWRLEPVRLIDTKNEKDEKPKRGRPRNEKTGTPNISLQSNEKETLLFGDDDI